jgi:hypothetical protein
MHDIGTLLALVLCAGSNTAWASVAIGTWSNVTPTGIALTGNDNYGVQDVLADPARPSDLYAFTCRMGVWKSTDYGLTWSKVGRDGGPLDQGKNWGSAMAPDGSYMLATSSSFREILKSTDGGATWTLHATTVWPYNADIDANDRTHAVATGHGETHLIESLDGGESWIDQGDMGGVTASSYVHFLLDGSTVLAVSGDDPAKGTWRGVKSGKAWTWTRVSSQEHDHGSHQLFIDRANRVIFNPGAAPGLGVQKSVDNGLTWTTASPAACDVVIGTATALYAARSFPNQGSWDPHFQHAALVPGTAWTADPTPTGMRNGPKRFAVTYDGSHCVVVAGSWNEGLWRLVEPPSPPPAGMKNHPNPK